MSKFAVFMTLTFIEILTSPGLDVFAENEKCCICQGGMSKFADWKIFTNSTNFKHGITQAFGVDQAGTASSALSVFLI